MIALTQWILSGLLLGLLYSVIAQGLVIVWRAGRIINLATGELIVVGGFLIYTFVNKLALPMALGIVIALALMAVLGVIIERGVFKPIIGQPMFALLMMTVALIFILRGLTIAIFGPEPQPFPAIFGMEHIFLGPFSFNPSLLWGGFICLALTFGLVWFFERTRWGLKLSTVAEDQVVAQSMGISVDMAISIAWIMVGLLAVFASTVFLNAKSVTHLASEIGFRGLPVALLGGIESVRGALIGGLIVGVAEMLARGYLDPITAGGSSAILPYVIMILVIIVRPQGLYGWRIIERV